MYNITIRCQKKFCYSYYYCFQEETLIEKLETEEIYSLRSEEKLQILSGLCHRIMNSYSVQDFMEEKQRNAAELW